MRISTVPGFQRVRQMPCNVCQNSSPGPFFRHFKLLPIHSNLHRTMQPFCCNPDTQHLYCILILEGCIRNGAFIDHLDATSLAA